MLSNLKVAHKLVVAFAVLVAAVAGAGALAWNGLSSFATTVAFFGNNVLWDLYEWSVRRDPT